MIIMIVKGNKGKMWKHSEKRPLKMQFLNHFFSLLSGVAAETVVISSRKEEVV